MAKIKNWKIVTSIRNIWGQEIRRDYRNIKSETDVIISTFMKNLWYVDIIDITGRRLGGKKFKTKTQALNYARKWMKTHRL